MIETSGTSPTLPKEAVNNKEIPLRYLVDHISSIPDQTKKVEKTRIALHYLLAEGRMVNSVDLLREINAEKLPFHEGERNNMLKGILAIAEKQYREDPSDAYIATENIRYFFSEGKNNSTFLTKEESEKFDKEALEDTSVIVTGRSIECILNPSLPRGHYEEAIGWKNIEYFVRQADERGYFDKIYNSLEPEVQQKLDPFISDDIKKKLGGIPTSGSAEKPAETMTHEVTEEIGEILSFKDERLEWQHRDHEITIRKMDNIDMWMIFFNVSNEQFDDNKWGFLSEGFDLANAIKDFKGIESGTAEKIYQALAKSFLNNLKTNNPVCVALLEEFPDTLFKAPNDEIVPIKASWGWGNPDTLFLVYPDKVEYYEDIIQQLDSKAIRSLDVTIGKAVLETWIKGSSTPTAATASVPRPEIAGPEPEKTTTGGKIIRMPEDVTDPEVFDEKLNDYLMQNQNEPRIAFISSIHRLKKYIISMAEEYDVRRGTIEANEKGDEITISDLRITRLGAGVTLDLVLSNDKDGIRADIAKFHRDVAAMLNKDLSRKEVGRQIENINSSIKEGLNQQIYYRNPSWSAGNISIADGKVRVEFEKSPENPALEKAEHEINTLPDLASNIAASEQFIKQLRDSSRYAQDLYQPQYMQSDLGFEVTKPVENGWFDAGSVVRTAMDRYKLPLAMYIDGNHARLVVKGAYQTPEGRKIKVYNPMNNGFEEISINETGMPVGVIANILTGGKVSEGEYDIASFFEDSKLVKYRDLLINVKAFGFQRDYQNCLPYCLFVNAMLYGLESGATEFKREGIRQFEQDFGVKILTREELILQNQE